MKDIEGYKRTGEEIEDKVWKGASVPVEFGVTTTSHNLGVFLFTN